MHGRGNLLSARGWLAVEPQQPIEPLDQPCRIWLAVNGRQSAERRRHALDLFKRSSPIGYLSEPAGALDRAYPLEAVVPPQALVECFYVCLVSAGANGHLDHDRLLLHRKPDGMSEETDDARAGEEPESEPSESDHSAGQ